MEKLQINYNPNGDARTFTHFPDYDEVKIACGTHKNNMKKILLYLSDYFKKRAEEHDNSVINNFDDYYIATLAAYNNELPFNESKWYKEHYNDESYRTGKTHPENAEILDLIEAMCDKRIMKLERMQESENLLNKEQIYQIYLNTIKDIENTIEVVL